MRSIHSSYFLQYVSSSFPLLGRYRTKEEQHEELQILVRRQGRVLGTRYLFMFSLRYTLLIE